MDEAKGNYRKLNPFVKISVGEDDIWARNDNEFCDVQTINDAPFKTLLNDINLIHENGVSKSRFLVGPAGSGKSHLFARLRRKLPQGHFTFAANPPSIPHSFRRFILKSIVNGMNMPTIDGDNECPYSQLEVVLYRHLQKILKPKGLSLNQIHRFCATGKLARKPTATGQFVKTLSKISPTGIPSHIGSILFDLLNEEKQDIALSWLRGETHLVESQLQLLGIADHLDDDGVTKLIKFLGYLSNGYGPIILILDQLDTIVEPSKIHEIESLMIDLVDSSRNYYLIISLLHEKFELWTRTLSMPFFGKFGIVDDNSSRLPTIELFGLSEGERRELLSARLNSKQLVLQRSLDGIADKFYPFTDSIVSELADSNISTARTLIQKASQLYLKAIDANFVIPVLTLQEFVREKFLELRLSLQEEDYAQDTGLLADRVKELLDLVWSVKNGSTLKVEEGGLHSQMARFEGVERVFSTDNKSFPIVMYDIQQTIKFPSVLSKILTYPPETILIRDGRIPVSGKVTKQRLDQFQKDKTFLHLTIEEIKTLHTLGKLLAEMNAGDYRHETTEPQPTAENIRECLSRMEDLFETEIARTFLRIMESHGLSEIRSDPVPGLQPDPVPTATHPLDASLLDIISTIMKKEQWMSFERLCYRASSHRGLACDPEQIGRYLTEQPMSDSIMIYPKNVDLLNQMGIVIWNMEDE